MITLFKHLLPKGRAWSLIVDKPLRRLFEGLSVVWSDIETYFGQRYLDLLVDDSTTLSEWEEQFAITQELANGADRLARLRSAWQASGGQSPAYVQNTLQAAGFDVYVHEWWDPAQLPTVVVREPLDYLTQFSNQPAPPLGYALVNRVTQIRESRVECGEDLAECGEPLAECNELLEYVYENKRYVIPADPATWAYFIYIGAETFGDLATIDADRREEFENLCLKICPAQIWLGMLVQYN